MVADDRGSNPNPLSNLEEWDDDLRRRYAQPDWVESAEKPADNFRNHTADVRPTVREFYRLNHKYQTVDFVRAKRDEFLPRQKRTMSIWDAMEYLNTLIDDSDPDIDLPQIEHLMQTAEQIRRDGHPRWFVLTGLIHDLGKVLCLFGEPQWAVVGDTFPVGCRFSDKIVLHEYFAGNPDSQVPEYQTECGIYERNCGLDNVLLSWGHDEYLYHICKDHLPEPALYMIRYHSFYPGHQDGAYDHLMNDHDREMFKWVRKFNPYDLYTKAHERPNLKELRPYYEGLIAEYFPPSLTW
jgi:inositol oxygenase